MRTFITAFIVTLASFVFCAYSSNVETKNEQLQKIKQQQKKINNTSITAENKLYL